MKFAVLMKATKETEGGVVPSREVMEAMISFNEGLAKDGVLLAAEGLRPSSKGSRLRFEGGRTTLTDGPFAETKELIAGYWIIEGKSHEEVIERFTHAPLDGGTTIEIRQFHQPDDFGDALTPEMRERILAVD